MTMTYGERHERELLTYHEWVKLGYAVSSGQFSKIKYRLHDGGVSVPLYGRDQVVSNRSEDTREVLPPVDFGPFRPTI